MPRLISADDIQRLTPQPQRGIANYEGGAVARAVGGLAQATGQVADVVQRENDVQAIFEARRKLDAWEREAIYDPAKGAINKLGKDALDLPEKLPADFDKFAGEVGATLQTPRQKQAFQELAQSRRNQVNDWTNRHTLTQRNAYEQGQYEADLDSVRQRAVQFAGDPAKVAAELSIGRARIVGFMRTKGRSEEETQAEILKQESRTHASVLQVMAEADAVAAQRYYEDNRKQIDGALHGQLDRIITGAATTQKALSFADSVATLPYDQQLAKVSEIKDQALKEKARVAVKQNHGDILAARQAVEKQASDSAWQTVGQGRKVPESVLATMDGRERVQLQDYLRQRAEHAATQGSKPVKTDPTALAKVYDLIRDKPDEFKALRMESLTFKLAGSDIEQVARIQRDMLDPNKEKDALTLAMQIGAYSRGMDDKDKGMFEAAAHDDVIQFQQQNKRPPNSKERQEILDRLKLDVVTDDGWLWDSKKKRYKMTPEELAKLPNQAAPKAIKTEADYNALPKGARYMAPDGTTRTKQ